MSVEGNRRYRQIGVDRLIRLNWLERTAALVLAGNDVASVKQALQQELRGAFRSNETTKRGSLDKTLTILMKIWVRPPRELHPLRCDGLMLLSHLPDEAHIAVHWGMTLAVYPFWGSVAARVGRLLRLQETVTACQIQRRLREQYGERETVSRRVRYVLRSFVDWGVLKDTLEKGVYSCGRKRAIADVALIAWLVEAFLYALPSGTAPFRTVLECPHLFPFRLEPVSAARLVSVSGRLELLRHSLDDELLRLRPHP